MPVTFRQEALHIKDGNTGEYKDASILVSNLPEAASQIEANAKAAIQAEGMAQVAAVTEEGTTQVENVNSAGTTQVTAVQNKGQEVLNSIPADYSAVVADVSTLESALSESKQYENVAFEQGTINSTAGTEDSSSRRIRSKVPYKNNGLYFVQLSSGFQFLISCYDANNAYLGNTSFSAAIDLTELHPLAGTAQFRFLIKNDSNTDLSPTDLSSNDFVVFSYKPYVPEATFNNLVCEPKHYAFVCRDSRVTDKVPPNSIYAIKAVAENQYDRVRFSVTKTQDGKYVAVHDTTINNLACNKNGTDISETINTKNCTLAQLNLYDWGLKFGVAYKGLQVPMVEECIALATKYNLPIALDFKWALDDTDIDAIFGMLAKYGQLDVIMYALSIANMQKFNAKSKRISFQWTAPTNVFNNDSHFNNFLGLASKYNTLYWLPDPLTGYPSDEDLQRAVLNDIKISHTQITDVSAILNNADKGVTMWECHYVTNIKTTLRNVVNDTIE